MTLPQICHWFDSFEAWQLLPYLGPLRALVPLNSLEVALASMVIVILVVYDVAADTSNRCIFRLGFCFPYLSSDFLRERWTSALSTFFPFDTAYSGPAADPSSNC